MNAFVFSVVTTLALASQTNVQTLPAAPDALSVTLPDNASIASVRYSVNDEWSEWEEFEIQNEHDPALRESNLVLLPDNAQNVQIKATPGVIVNPIIVSNDPVRYTLAARTDPGQPRILSRSDWGANDELLYASTASRSSVTAATPPSVDNGDAEPSQRVQDCEAAQLNHPQEFKSVRKTTKDPDGRRYRWAREYSPKVKLLTVHHTAVKVEGDARPAVERIRALYQYHAVNRGWGDIGYHYLIDEEGRIYEGKSGGDAVVGGHAYCHNIGSIGVSMLGNFEIEQPTQQQLKSLQWLLRDLAEHYDIDLERDVSFHGKILPAVVAHRDLVSTECPGYYVIGSMDQIRTHVANNDVDGTVTLPKPRVTEKPKTPVKKAPRKPSRQSGMPVIQEGITSIGDTVFQGRPGDLRLFSVRYQAGASIGRKFESAGNVRLDDEEVVLWQELDGQFVLVTDKLKLPQAVAVKNTIQLRLKVQFPTEEGRYTFRLGTTTFTLDASGRRILPRSAASTSSAISRSSRSRTSRPAVSSVPSRASRPARSSAASHVIKVRLESREKGETSCGDVDLQTIRDHYRGSVACVMVDGRAAIINTVGLEDYLLGLAEEPDTEPYEKQRAFAIAARSYAAYYTHPDHRKFPGKPYDGSDSPATFQIYRGLDFEVQNPEWLRAARSTTNKVLMVDDEVIKVPYFSSDTGRTRTPEEAGWNNFPHAAIFSSKADPWCEGMQLRGHGVGMSGCGAEAQAHEGKSGEDILDYYYPGTVIARLR